MCGVGSAFQRHPGSWLSCAITIADREEDTVDNPINRIYLSHSSSWAADNLQAHPKLWKLHRSYIHKQDGSDDGRRRRRNRRAGRVPIRDLVLGDATLHPLVDDGDGSYECAGAMPDCYAVPAVL